MSINIEEAEQPTKEEYAELKRIEEKIRLWILRGQYECHRNSEYCHKCGHGFSG